MFWPCILSFLLVLGFCRVRVVGYSVERFFVFVRLFACKV